MNLRLVASCGLVCAALALTGCDEGRPSPAKITVQVANAAPGFAELGFRREQRDQVTTLSFKGVQAISYDVDTYDFFVFERALLATQRPRTWTFSSQLQDAREHTFVLTEVGGEVQPVVLESPPAPAADAQIVALHAAAGFPAMDLYLERPGVGIAGATPRGTFNVQGQIAARTLPSGEYELWLTAAGNPGNVLLTSVPITLPAGVTSTFIVVSEAAQGGGQLSVMLVQPTPSLLFDRNATARLRVVNGATDTAPRDFAIGGQFSPPLFSAIPFAEPTAYATIAPGTQQINVTPVGNPGVLELDQPFTGFAAEYMTVLFTGPAGTLAAVLALDDGRRIHNEAKLLLLNAAAQFPGIDFVVVDPGLDPGGVFAFATLGTPGATGGYGNLAPGEYDLYLRRSDTLALLSGPTRLTLAGEGLYGVIAINGPDTATAAISLFDDFP
jgi:hypothetical protein